MKKYNKKEWLIMIILLLLLLCLVLQYTIVLLQ